MKKPLRLFTAVWGEKHLNWWKEGCLTSLSWPKNREALNGATWAVLTKKENMPFVENCIAESGIYIKDIEFYVLDDALKGDDPRMGAFLLQAWLQEINRALTYGAQTLTAPPDTVFGEGTVQSLRAIAEVRDVAVAVPHPRVLPSLLESIKKDTPMSNAKLVGLAWRNLHKTWTDAEVGLLQSNSYIGGVSWRFLDEGLYAVTHRLPTPYLINFIPEDLVYFKNQIHYGVLDHDYPGQMFIRRERQRTVGSSDAAFIVEITEAHLNVPPVEHVRSDEPDLFWRNELHNRHNRQISVIFRGEN